MFFSVVRLLQNRAYLAIALVTLLTFALVGTVILTTTSVGCAPANWLKVKAARCVPVASVTSPTPVSQGLNQATPIPPNPNPPVNPGASSYPPTNPGASSYPPYNPGASSYPPYNGGSSAGSPYDIPASGYPPMANPSSGASGAQSLGLNCRLPVYNNQPGSGGFIVFPGATFIADPRSGVTVPSPSPGAPTPAPGYGMGFQGWYGLTYDAAYSKWLAVPYHWVSPDGAHYAYPYGGDIYVQSVAGGAGLELAQGQNLTVVGVENNGVYASSNTQGGMWFLPFSGAAKQISQFGFWQRESHGAAYGTETSSVPPGASNVIMRLDLATGSSVQFFTWRGGQSSVEGFDLQGHPVIRSNYPNGYAIVIATAPNTASVIHAVYWNSYPAPILLQGPPIADGHGLWYSTGGGFVLLANGWWYGMSSVGGQLAGPCA